MWKRKEEVAFVVFFFFSSRRRHTRCSRDWSSDVCSSDLMTEGFIEHFNCGSGSDLARFCTAYAIGDRKDVTPLIGQKRVFVERPSFIEPAVSYRRRIDFGFLQGLAHWTASTTFPPGT